MGMPAKNIAGMRFGRLTPVERAPKRPKDRDARWICRCDCGGTVDVLVSNLRKGHTQSCGCLLSEWGREHAATLHSPKHGHAPAGRCSRTYTTWTGMKQRCTNPKDEFFKDYGGRGIYVADEFQTFKGFLAHMGEKPMGLSLGRIDNDGPYSPANCRWETMEQQMLNRRSNRRLSFRGENLTLKEWSDRLGFRSSLLGTRINRQKWSVEKSLTTPPRPMISRHP